nr:MULTISPECIES: hypothetical protein [unclassified Blastococcus]
MTPAPQAAMLAANSVGNGMPSTTSPLPAIATRSAYSPTGMASAKKTEPPSRHVERVAATACPSTSAVDPGRCPTTSVRGRATPARLAVRDGPAGSPLARLPGSRPRYRAETSAPASPQASRTASAAGFQPAPGENGSNWSRSASAKGRTGKMPPTAAIQGSSPPMVKTPDTKASTTAVLTEAAWATAEVGETAATARPRAAKQAVPSTRVTTVAGSVRPMIWTPKPTTPTATAATTAANAYTTAPPIRPATYDHDGSGVPRNRLTTPRSRASASPIATGGYAEYSTPRATAVGVANCITRRPVASSRTSFPAAAPMTSSQTSGSAMLKTSTTRERHMSVRT